MSSDRGHSSSLQESNSSRRANYNINSRYQIDKCLVYQKRPLNTVTEHYIHTSTGDVYLVSASSHFTPIASEENNSEQGAVAEEQSIKKRSSPSTLQTAQGSTCYSTSTCNDSIDESSSNRHSDSSSLSSRVNVEVKDMMLMMNMFPDSSFENMGGKDLNERNASDDNLTDKQMASESRMKNNQSFQKCAPPNPDATNHRMIARPFQQQLRQNPPLSAPTETLASNEEWKRWKGGWRKVKKSSPNRSHAALEQSNMPPSPQMEHNQETAAAPSPATRIITPRISNSQGRKEIDVGMSSLPPFPQDHSDDANVQQQSKMQVHMAQETHSQIHQGAIVSPTNPPLEAEANILSIGGGSFSPLRQYPHEFIGNDDNEGVIDNSKSPGGRSGASSHPGLRFHPSGSCVSQDEDDYDEEGDSDVLQRAKDRKSNEGGINNDDDPTPLKSGTNIKERRQPSSQSAVDNDASLSSDSHGEGGPSTHRMKAERKEYHSGSSGSRRDGGISTRDKIHVGKISDDKKSRSDARYSKEKKRSTRTKKEKKSAKTAVANFVTAPLEAFHEFITGNSCWTPGDVIPFDIGCGRSSEDDDDASSSQSNSNRDYEGDEDEEDATLDDYDDSTCREDESLMEFRKRRNRSRAESMSETSSLQYTADDETISRESSKSSIKYRQNAKKIAVKVKPSKPEFKPTKESEKKVHSRRGRSPTLREGHNSGSSERYRQSTLSRDAYSTSSGSIARRSASRGTKSYSSYDGDDTDSINELINNALESGSVDSEPKSHISFSESVLSQDHSTWKSMTAPLKSTTKEAQSAADGNIKSLDDKKSREKSVVDSFFKKVISVGIQLHLNIPPNKRHKMASQKRKGKLFLRFGTRNNGKFEEPSFVWKDAMENSTPTMENFSLFDISSIRKPSVFELDSFPMASADSCFFVSRCDGNSLLFEAIDNVQMTRVSSALKGIVAKMTKSIITGDDTWITQMLASVHGSSGDEYIVTATTDVTDHLIKKSIVDEAYRKMRAKQVSVR